jgi:hypothetical protein
VFGSLHVWRFFPSAPEPANKTGVSLSLFVRQARAVTIFHAAKLRKPPHMLGRLGKRETHPVMFLGRSLLEYKLLLPMSGPLDLANQRVRRHAHRQMDATNVRTALSYKMPFCSTTLASNASKDLGLLVHVGTSSCLYQPPRERCHDVLCRSLSVGLSLNIALLHTMSSFVKASLGYIYILRLRSLKPTVPSLDVDSVNWKEGLTPTSGRVLRSVCMVRIKVRERTS